MMDLINLLSKSDIYDLGYILKENLSYCIQLLHILDFLNYMAIK